MQQQVYNTTSEQQEVRQEVQQEVQQVYTVLLNNTFKIIHTIHKVYIEFCNSMRSPLKGEMFFMVQKVYSDGPLHKHRDCAKPLFERKKEIPAGAVAELAGLKALGVAVMARLPRALNKLKKITG